MDCHPPAFFLSAMPFLPTDFQARSCASALVDAIRLLPDLEVATLLSAQKSLTIMCDGGSFSGRSQHNQTTGSALHQSQRGSNCRSNKVASEHVPPGLNPAAGSDRRQTETVCVVVRKRNFC